MKRLLDWIYRCWHWRRRKAILRWMAREYYTKPIRTTILGKDGITEKHFDLRR